MYFLPDLLFVFVRALQACVHYFSAYLRTSLQIQASFLQIKYFIQLWYKLENLNEILSCILNLFLLYL
jgi:hypothetical protein